MRLLIVARNRTVAVEDDRITSADGTFDSVLHFPDADVRPGLINAHDHLHRNHYGRLGQPPYRHAYDWALDIQERHRRHIARGRSRPRPDALLEGAWKNLFAGVTSVVHHDSWEPDFETDFPLRVIRLPSADSLAMTPRFAFPPGDVPFSLHLAEGVDDKAADEVHTLAARDMLGPRLLAVHGVGMDATGIAQFRAAGAALVWCPTSNHFLFGRTAPVDLLAEGVDVLLGSDSRLTGAGDLLDELRFAHALGTLDDKRLEQAVGNTAARRLGLPSPSLEPGSQADLCLITRPILGASAEDVVLVMVAGVLRVARPDIAGTIEGIAGKGRETRVGSVTRWTNMRPNNGGYREKM